MGKDDDATDAIETADQVLRPIHCFSESGVPLGPGMGP